MSAAAAAPGLFLGASLSDAPAWAAEGFCARSVGGLTVGQATNSPRMIHLPSTVGEHTRARGVVCRKSRNRGATWLEGGFYPRCVFRYAMGPAMDAMRRSSTNPNDVRRIVQYLPKLISMAVLSAAAWGQASGHPLPLLTHADQVRQLSPEQAALGYPVRVRGVVTDDVPAPDFFVQDSTAGVYVEGLRTENSTHHFSDLIEVEGITGPGKFAPVIIEQKSRVLGKASLPHSRIYSFDELADGQLDSQWVEVRGIVRAVSIDRTSWRETTLALRIASGGGQLSVRLPISEEQDFSSWIDAEVLLEGVCGSLFNAQRQLTA